MNQYLSTWLAVFALSSFSATASKNDALAELARSQNMKEILQANQRANQDEWLRGACQRQITERQWPTTCWEWLEQELKNKDLSDKKKQQWTRYLTAFCQHLAEQQRTAALHTTRSSLWKNSRCAILAKKFGPGFEDSDRQ